MTRLLAFALLGSLSLSACAQPAAPGGATGKAAEPAAAKAASSGDATVDANIDKALKQLGPQLEADYIGKAPLPGFREVIVGGQLLYISDDGKYMLQGSVIDIANRRDLSQTSSGLRNYRKQLIASVPRAERIVFAPPNPKYTLSVFTDVECGYCRKMHSEIAEYNRQGIAVEYLAFPRMGLGSQDHKDMISVWCASDRRKALTDAKTSGTVAAKDCTNPVAREYDLGQRVGVTGTPAVFAADGTQLGGYLPPAQMRAALDKLGAAATAGGMK